MASIPRETMNRPRESIDDVIRRVWGFDTLRPLQREAMTAAQEGRDALVVLPTGGGKSLCYQAPALIADRPTVVVSPLIALMKDQVDALLQRGVPAAFLNSSLDAADRRRVSAGIADQEFKLIFVAPERFASDAFWNLLDSSGVGAFAIDEAHCISHWGHDFRGDYRRLDQLKRRFPDAAIHAFTATATPRVRDDVIGQLKLRDPAVLVGDFFRPNLKYRVARRGDSFNDVLETIKNRPGQPGIVYCIRRRDVDELAAYLKVCGIRAVGYHAGMTDEKRVRAQDAFAAAKFDVVVATVAFGMGIDRADIRFVIHAGMPKSIEHYQQETGRAGRDGKPADCIMLYNGSDFQTWKFIIEKTESAEFDNYIRLLDQMYAYCSGVTCRHKSLVTYFGQRWTRESCGACDICTDSIDTVPDATIIAQKIMSAVYRTGERFGAAYVCDVLTGSSTERVIELGHDQIPTFGALEGHAPPEIRAWIDQLIDQDMLARDGKYRVLTITDTGWQVLRSKAEARLLPVAKASRKTRRKRTTRRETAPPVPHPSHNPAIATDDDALFERLREYRRLIAEELKMPAFYVFSDKTLREIARTRPSTHDELLALPGIGPAKLDAFGDRFLKFLRNQA